VKFDKRTAKTMSGDVGISASEGLKGLLNLEAFQNPTESHPLDFKLNSTVASRVAPLEPQRFGCA
jgi:hypothetical protein